MQHFPTYHEEYHAMIPLLQTHMQAHEGCPQHNIQQVPIHFHVLILIPWTPTSIFKIILQKPCDKVKVDIWA